MQIVEMAQKGCQKRPHHLQFLSLNLDSVREQRNFYSFPFWMAWVGSLAELRYFGSRTKVGETVSSMTDILIFVNILTLTVSRAQLFERRLAITRVSFHQKHSIEWFSLFFLEYPMMKLQAKRIKLNLIFKLSYLSSNFALTLGYLDPASNNPAQNSLPNTINTI